MFRIRRGFTARINGNIATEYAILAGGVALGLIAIVYAMGDEVVDLYDAVVAAWNDAE